MTDREKHDEMRGDDNWAVGANEKNEVVVLTPRETAEHLAMLKAERELDEKDEA